MGNAEKMALNCLEFERPIAELEAKIEDLCNVSDDGDVDLVSELEQLRGRSRELTQSIFGSLTAWQVALLARHPLRPHMLDYIEVIFDEFEELHGDRAFGDDAAIVGGLARLDGKPVVVVGHQKGRDTAQKIHRNFAMPRPLLTFIDTPGAYPGMDAEERGQSEAIARNLLVMAGLKTPIVCTVIGEGGSGGALAIGVGDHVQMMEYATYAVISPEGCASILWKSAEKAEQAAQAMGITAKRLEELGLVDQLIEEPLGGAHRDPQAAASTLHDALTENVERLIAMPTEELLQRRHERLRSYGNLA